MSKKQNNYFWLLTVLASLQLLQLFYFFTYFDTNHYLPTPFIHDKNDTLMDFFNPLFWSDVGMYSIWKSVYPPVNFLVLDFLKGLGCTASFISAFEARDVCIDSAKIFIVIAICSISIAYFTAGILFFKIPLIINCLLFLIIIMSSPLLFAIERGNLIIFSVPLIVAITCNFGVLRSVVAGILVNIKPYLIIPVVYSFNKYNAKSCLHIFFYAGLIYVISGFFLNDNTILMINNLLFFSSQNLFSGFEVLSLPSSFSSLLYVFKIKNLNYGILNKDSVSVLWIGLILLLLVCWLASWIFLKSNIDGFAPLFIQGLFIIPILIMSAGGYSILLVAGALPYLYRYYPRTFITVLLVLAPFDLIVLNEFDLGKQISFLSDTTVYPRWQFTFGIVARPLLLVCANFVFCYEIYAHKIKKNAL